MAPFPFVVGVPTVLEVNCDIVKVCEPWHAGLVCHVALSLPGLTATKISSLQAGS